MIARHPAFEVAAGVAAGVTDAAIVGKGGSISEGKAWSKKFAISSKTATNGVFLSNYLDMARSFEENYLYILFPIILFTSVDARVGTRLKDRLLL